MHDDVQAMHRRLLESTKRYESAHEVEQAIDNCKRGIEVYVDVMTRTQLQCILLGLHNRLGSILAEQARKAADQERRRHG